MPVSFFGLRFLLIILFLYNVVTVKLMFDSIYIITQVVKTGENSLRVAESQRLRVGRNRRKGRQKAKGKRQNQKCRGEGSSPEASRWLESCGRFARILPAS
jgi:hypothetical protein